MDLSQALIARRGNLGLSVTKAHYRLEVNRATYDAWERGMYTPKPEQWEKLAEFLEVTRLEVAVLVGAISRAELRRWCKQQHADKPADSPLCQPELAPRGDRAA